MDNEKYVIEHVRQEIANHSLSINALIQVRKYSAVCVAEKSCVVVPRSRVLITVIINVLCFKCLRAALLSFI